MGSVRFTLLVPLLATAVACSNSNSPAAPSNGGSSSNSNSTVGTSSVVAPRPVGPLNGAQIANAAQPITLVVQNGLVTGDAAATYTFEIATDQAFANKVQTKDGVAQGSGGTTSVTLDRLAAATDYYWHVRAQGGGTTGVFSAPFKFTVGPAIVINPPSPAVPLNGAVTTGWPTFTVINANRSGPVGSIVYRFEVSTTATFATTILSATVPEAANQTSYTPAANTAAPSTRALYWRATAVDQINSVSSQPSAVQSFTYSDPSAASQIAAQQGVVLWPGVQPTGTPGKARMGGGWDVRMLTSFDGVTHMVPTLEELRMFDLIDRGMDPGSALAWMNANGYFTAAVYYPSVAVIGFPFEYMAYVDGAWGLVVRVGA